MKSDLIDAINVADATNNQKAKKILLKIAEMPEDKQGDTLKLIKLMMDLITLKQWLKDIDKLLDEDFAEVRKR